MLEASPKVLRGQVKRPNRADSHGKPSVNRLSVCVCEHLDLLNKNRKIQESCYYNYNHPGVEYEPTSKTRPVSLNNLLLDYESGVFLKTSTS